MSERQHPETREARQKVMYWEKDPSRFRTPLHWRVRLKHPETEVKWIRPMRLNGSCFELGGPEYPDGKPLYPLHELAARPEETMWLAEGEWCADALKAGAILPGFKSLPLRQNSGT